jgi:type VI protein secretion system component VasF
MAAASSELTNVENNMSRQQKSFDDFLGPTTIKCGTVLIGVGLLLGYCYVTETKLVDVLKEVVEIAKLLK